jgi:NADH:ubiquinone reductase (H+-translocating)
MLLDTAPRPLPQLDERLSKTADRVLRRHGVEVLAGASVTEALDGYVQLSTVDKMPTRSLMVCRGPLTRW